MEPAGPLDGKAPTASAGRPLRPGDLDLSDPDLYVARGGAPHDYLAMLRREDPVHWQPPPETPRTRSPIERGYWVLTRHADCVAAARAPDLFSSSARGPFLFDLEEDGLTGVRCLLIGQDPPHHTRLRSRIEEELTPQRAKELEPGLRERIGALVGRVAPRGSGDLVGDLAAELPLLLLGELLGIPGPELARLRGWAMQLVGADDRELSRGADAMEAATQLWLGFHELGETQRQRPDTWLGRLAQTGIHGPGLSGTELDDLCLLLLVAAHEPLRHAATHVVRLLLEHPEPYARVRTDPDRHLPGVIEETLRYASPVLGCARTATADTEIGGRRIRAGDKVVLSYASANRDEAQFGDPMRFDPAREPNPHLGFGCGEHGCLGADLARMALGAFLREVLTRLPALEAAAPPRFQRSCVLAGIRELRVRW